MNKSVFFKVDLKDKRQLNAIDYTISYYMKIN